MAIALVQQGNGSQGSGTSLVVNISAPAAGNALVLICGQNSDAITAVSSTGATWALLKKSAFNFYASEIWYAENVSGSPGGTITITFGSSTRAAAIVAEFSGIKTSGAADSGAALNQANGTSTSASPGALDPTAAPALYLAAASCQNSTFTGTIGGGFTKFTDPTPGGGALSVQGVYLIDNSTHVAATPTMGVLASAAWDSAGGALLGTAGIAAITVTPSPVVAYTKAPQGESLGVGASSASGAYLRRRILLRY